MKKLLIAASSVLAFVVPGTAQASQSCTKTFTVQMAQRAADANWRGTRKPTSADAQHLHRFLACQKNPGAKPFVRQYYAHDARLNRQRRNAASMSYAVASWYSDTNGKCASPAGCSTYGIAHKSLAFGTLVTICYHGCVNAVVDDRGPFEPGRTFDLNEHVAAAVGMYGVATVAYRIG